MNIIFVITALVLIVSLYDYYTSRSWQQVTSDSRNEVVFESRNKNYGAYQIRKDYNRNLLLIILTVTGSIGMSYGIHRYVQGANETVTDPTIDYSQFSMELPPVEEEILPPPPPEPEIPKLEKMMAFLPPIVTDNEVKDKLPTQDELEKNKAGNVDQQGDDENFTPPKNEKLGAQVTQQTQETFTYVDVEAEYPGGYAEMVKFISKNIKYPQEGVEMGVEGKVYMRFVVGSDGNIENVRVIKGIEDYNNFGVEATKVINKMPKWKAGEINGKAVRSYFDLPINFKLD